MDRQGRWFDSVSVYIARELDLATTVLLDRALRRAERCAPLVVLDLGDVTYMDSAGLHVIVTATARTRQAGRRLVIKRGPSQLDALFTVPGVAEVVEISDLDPFEAPVQALAQLPRADHAA